MSATPLHIAQMRRAVCQRQLSILFKELEALRYRKPLKAADSAKFVQLLPRRALIKILFFKFLDPRRDPDHQQNLLLCYSHIPPFQKIHQNLSTYITILVEVYIAQRITNYIWYKAV